MKKTFLAILSLIALGITSCGQTNKPKPDNPNTEDTPTTPVEPEKPSDPVTTPEPEKPIKKTIFDSLEPGKNKEYGKLTDFSPTRFKKDTFKKVKEEKLIDGATHITYSFKLNSDNTVIADVIDVDLKVAKLDTNYSKNGVSTVYNQLKDYEATENKKVAAIINADFFFTGYGPSINAYVNNSEVIKEGHNDKGGYDYTDLNNDIPASKPMLLGISGDEAKIAPSIENGSIKDTIQAKFSNQIVYLDADNNEHFIKNNISLNNQAFTDNVEVMIITNNIQTKVPKDAKIYKVKKETSNTFTKGTLESTLTQKLEGTKSFKDTDKYFYVISRKDLGVKSGTKFGISTANKDGSFDHYNEIIGGRQSLVENGEIAKTVTLENSNGAQRTNIPRSAVGVKDKNHVVFCAIESLRYNKKLTNVKDTDGYGVNLPELAEFMRYIGCYDALNFDGGGSTQLITQKENEAPQVKVRSSDYGTYDLNSGRKVYNTLLVTKK